MTKQSDLYWVAGLLEGEGSFLLATTKQRGHTYFHPRIDLTMTDEDVVARASAVLGGTYRRVRYADILRADGYNRKPCWKCSIYSGNALKWMKRLMPLMGERRRAKIKDLIKKRNEIRNKPWGKRNIDVQVAA